MAQRKPEFGLGTTRPTTLHYPHNAAQGIYCKTAKCILRDCSQPMPRKIRRGSQEKKRDALKQPNRRQVKKGQLRARQRQLKRQLMDIPQQEKIWIHVLLDGIKQEILVLSRAENHRKRRKKMCKTRESFYRNPYAFPKKLFTTAKSGPLDIPQQELEDYLRKTYSDHLKEVPLPPMDGIPPLEEPETSFRAGGCMRPGSLLAKPAPAAPQGWMVSPSSSTRIAQLSWNSSFAFYKEPGGKYTSHKNGAWLMGSGYPRRRTPLEWAPFAQSLSSTSKARFSLELSTGEWLHSSSRTSTSTRQSRRLASQGFLVAWSMLKWSGIRWWLRSTRRKNSMSYGLTWPTPMDLCRTTASSLHWSSSTSQRKWLTS